MSNDTILWVSTTIFFQLVYVILHWLTASVCQWTSEGVAMVTGVVRRSVTNDIYTSGSGGTRNLPDFVLRATTRAKIFLRIGSRRWIETPLTQPTDFMARRSSLGSRCFILGQLMNVRGWSSCSFRMVINITAPERVSWGFRLRRYSIIMV